MTKKCIFILTNGEWESGDWALYIRSTPETAHFLCGSDEWILADVYFFITTIGELLHFFMLLFTLQTVWVQMGLMGWVLI